MKNYFLGQHNSENGRVKLALADIQKSGLSYEMLHKTGIKLFSEGPDVLRERIGFNSLNGNHILAVAVLMEIPYHTEKGNIAKYEYRLYPETDGKKYLHPLGSIPVPYIPPDTWHVKNKVQKPVFITEGAKKVLKLTQTGAYCIGLPGVWGFRATKNKEARGLFCETLEGFTWRGRTVYLAFDMDLWTNPQVRKALLELAFHLTARGGLVCVCTWKGKKGIDDYLATVAEPEKALSEIRDKAKPVTSFITPEHRDDVLFALSHTIGNMDQLTHEIIINTIAKKFNLKPRSLQKALSQITGMSKPDLTDDQKEQAKKLLRSPKLIKLYLDVCHTRYVGRDKTLLLIKLATLTRHLSRGLSVVLLGTSSVGKSALINIVLKTMNPAVLENFSRTSAQYLLYRKEPLTNKVITFYEFNGADSSSAIIRTALTEGELHLGTVQKDASGSLSAVNIRKETKGLVILSTFTGSRVDPELSTRVLLQEITHDEAITREVFRQKAEGIDDNWDAFHVWQWADTLIEARKVVIPYFNRLAETFPTHEERFHRDFDKTVMLVKACALLHQYQRERTGDGAVIATEEDYRIVYDLGDAFAQSMLPVSHPVVKMLNAIKSMKNTTKQELQAQIGVSNATMKRYLAQARQADLIETEGRGLSQKIKVIDTPASYTVLPDPEIIFENQLNGSHRLNGNEPKTIVDIGYSTAHSSIAQTEESVFISKELPHAEVRN